MWEAFDRLGQDIDRRWRERCHRTDDLPAIAAQALADHALHTRVTHEELVMGALAHNQWPAQFNSRFGQPPLNVFVGQGFFVEVLTWIDATTSVHQHNFSGAFSVLAGSSVHSQYAFHGQRREGPRFKSGEVLFSSCELLNVGDVRQILSGDRLIHSLFHLEQPSVTVVVRTYDDATGPQYEYYRPWIALDPFHDPEPASTQLRLLRGLAQLKSPLLVRGLEQALVGSDALMAFRCLEVAREHVAEGDDLTRVLRAAQRRHGDLADQMMASVVELRRQRNIALRRNAVVDVDPRYLLALLLNVPERASILDMVARRYPGQDPVSVVVRTLADAAGKKQIGLTLNAVSVAILDGLLREHSFAHIREDLARRYPREEVARQEPALRSVADELERSVFLAPLFARTGQPS